MAFQLSREDQRGKTELLAHAREKHLVVCAQIDAFNAMMEAARESIEAAMGEYDVAIEQLHRFAAETEGAASRAFEAKPQSWRESPEGVSVLEWIACYHSFKPKATAGVVPQEIEALNDRLLSDFEELPDAP